MPLHGRTGIVVGSKSCRRRPRCIIAISGLVIGSLGRSYERVSEQSQMAYLVFAYHMSSQSEEHVVPPHPLCDRTMLSDASLSCPVVIFRP